MPRDSFLAVVKHEISVPKLKDVARLFQTSLSATGIRCSELLPIVAFEVEGQEVTWGSKMVTKGPVNRVDPKILRIINDAVRMTYGERELFMDSDDHHGKWKLEWEQIGNQKKTLFLLHPCLPTPAKPKTELVPAKRSSVVNAV